MKRFMSFSVLYGSCSADLRAVCRRIAFRPYVGPWRRTGHNEPRRPVSAQARHKKALQELIQLHDTHQTRQSSPCVSGFHWTSPLTVRKYPDPCLRAQNRAVVDFDGALACLTRDMLDCMYSDNGIGLAAPQVGVNVRVMVFNEAGIRGKGQECVLVNPEIVATTDDAIEFEEGCLSFPHLYGNVSRPGGVTVEALDASGTRFELKLKGLAARIFQHEFDHLQGTLFIDRMAEPDRDAIEGGIEELVAAFQEAHAPGAEPAL